MAQKPLTNAKMFTATWTEKDEATLIDLLNRKINELKYDIRSADSPYIKARLKAKRKEYKEMLAKVMTGDYNSNVIVGELATAVTAQKMQNQSKKSKKGAKVGKYVDSYADVNFDFKSYFNKTRYYGVGLPLISAILVVVMLFTMLIGLILPKATISEAESYIASEDTKLTLSSIGYFKLGADEMDFRVKNDGNWPKGTYLYGSYELEDGERYKAKDGTYPEYVYLYSDLKMASIDITTYDVLMSALRFSFWSDDFVNGVEDAQGRNWYFLRYMVKENRFNDYEIAKDAAGNYDAASIVRNIATYGIIIFMWLAILLFAVELVLCIVRMFTYTSRRLHAIPILAWICAMLALICPVFLEISALDGATLSAEFSNYFTYYWSDFLVLDGQVTFNMLIFILWAAIPFVLINLPFIFKNRASKPITFVPKGNRPHVYSPDQMPVKPNGLPQSFAGKSPYNNARPKNRY